jgi:uncharacterized protein
MSDSAGNSVAAGDQAQLIQTLCSATVYPHQADAIRLIETHISWIILTGTFAYKIKKPVDFGFLDFSTLEKRQICCLEEIRLNNRFPNKLYLEVLAITGTAGQPSMNGKGEVIEYAVKMKQFSAGHLLIDLAQRGELAPEMIDQLALIVAEFHDSVAKAEPNSPYGEPDEIKHWFDENFHHIKSLVVDAATLRMLATLETWGDLEWRKNYGLMQLRKQQGRVRECHGDLHLGNITLIEGQVTPFDCIEFNPMLRWIDVISEIAFLVMDLLDKQMGNLAYRLLNRYLQQTGDYQGLLLLRYYLVYRAMVRSKVAMLRAQQCADGERQQALAVFAAYIELAASFTKTGRVFLLLTHGYSGSGKSTYASQVAEHFKAIHIRSDVERKRMHGYKAQATTGSGIATGIYTPSANEDTYKRLLDLANCVLDAGFPVIVDAAFLKREQRELFVQSARECMITWLILDFTAPVSVLEMRINLRKNDASEATTEVLRQQQLTAQPLSEAERQNTIIVDTDSVGADKRLLTELEKWLL